MGHGKQGSHSGLELFFTDVFSVPDRECCNLQFVVYFLKFFFPSETICHFRSPQFHFENILSNRFENSFC